MIKNPFLYAKPTVYPLRRGSILISVPLSGSVYFDRTVILLIEHNEKGSFGIMLNKSLPIALRDIFKNIEKRRKRSINLYNGGPLEIDNLFAVHTYGNLIKGSSHIIDELYFGGFSSELLQSIKNDTLDENLIRFYLGYTGWSAGQLESELKKSMWVVGQFDEKLLFHSDDEKCWKMAVETLEKPYSSWFNIVKQPFLN